MTKMLLTAAAIALVACSCKKDKDKTPDPVTSKTHKELIVGTWNLKQSITHSLHNGNEYRDTTYGTNEKVKFTAGGMMVAYDENGAVDDSTHYSVPQNGMLVVGDVSGDTDTLQIQLLDEHNMKVYDKYNAVSGDYDEDWTTLSR